MVIVQPVKFKYLITIPLTPRATYNNTGCSASIPYYNSHTVAIYKNKAYLITSELVL